MIEEDEQQVGGAVDDDVDVIRPARQDDEVALPPVAFRNVDGPNVVLISDWVVHNNHFGVDKVAYRFTPRNLDDGLSVLEQFMLVVNQVFTHCVQNFDPSDLVQCFCTADSLRRGSITMPLTPVRQLFDGASLLFEYMAKVIQSNDAVVIDDGSFKMELYHVSTPRFGGYTRTQLAKRFTSFTNEQQDVLTKSYIEIPDVVRPFCAGVALIVALSYLRTGRKRCVRYPNKLKKRAQALFRDCGLASGEAYVTDDGLHIAGLKKLCRHPDFCQHPVLVFDDSRCNVTIFKANLDEIGEPIYLHYVDGHLNVITKVNAMFGKDGFFCKYWDKFLRGSYTHKCDRVVCKQCKGYCDSKDELNCLAL